MRLLRDLYIRMTAKCNFNCKHCYAAHWLQDNIFLDKEIIVSAIEQAKQLGCQNIIFTGGEALLSTHIVDGILYAFKSGLSVTIETNGSCVDKLFVDAKSVLPHIHFKISYDGECMRGSSQLAEKVRSNIIALKKLDCHMEIQTVLTVLNLEEADHIFDFTREINVGHRVFLSHSKTGNAKDLELFIKEGLPKLNL